MTVIEGLADLGRWIAQELQAVALVQFSSWSQVTDKSIGPVWCGVKLVHGTEADAMVSWDLRLGI